MEGESLCDCKVGLGSSGYCLYHERYIVRTLYVTYGPLLCVCLVLSSKTVGTLDLVFKTKGGKRRNRLCVDCLLRLYTLVKVLT